MTRDCNSRAASRSAVPELSTQALRTSDDFIERAADLHTVVIELRTLPQAKQRRDTPQPFAFVLNGQAIELTGLACLFPLNEHAKLKAQEMQRFVCACAVRLLL
ncbi:hypothetical protein SAMN05444171_1550 [Bradyrhizobium lablabi]|uniref:Uncharacterized protein n=2 Tax=Bradyrhizobium TaxID=374 RepID=A0ABY0Q4J8_9BRAD|nr:hypothetical protein SAMN05444163_5609 [Bradyrhizobium ottawaense]SEC49462.1 hypothetical protein SAMN05444171_1550 [Bradyrhizobium lablabi]SHK69898.1 hypothetical protein SAMN05444321_0381 [Bradyrhizobium lablabi]